MTKLILNNGVEMPALGLGVFQTPPDETRAAVTAALETGYRHIDTAAAYGNEREVGEAVGRSGLARDEVFVETKIWISDYGYDETLHGFEKSAAKLGVDQIDLLILHQALPSDFDKTLEAYRALETLLERRQGPGHRRQQLHGRPPHRAARQGDGRAGREPDRGAPLLPAARGAGVRRRARHPDAGVVADRRHHLLPRRQPRQHAGGPGDRRDRRGARQDAGAGDAALAPAGGPLGDPQVDQAAPHRRELRRLRLRADRRRAGRHRRARHRPARRPRAGRDHPREPSAGRSPRPDAGPAGRPAEWSPCGDA